MTRLPLLLGDLEMEIRRVAPQVSSIEVLLPTGAYGPVAEELANHFGSPLASGAAGARSISVGIVKVRRAE